MQPSAAAIRYHRPTVTPASPDPFLDRLRAVVGPPNVLTDPADTAGYLEDWRQRYHGRARAVVRPHTAAEVAEVVRAARSFGVPIVPQGGNTGMCGGATPGPEGNELVLSLGRMTAIRAIDPDNAAAYYTVGSHLSGLRQYPRAEEMLRTAIARAPWWMHPRNTLGLLLTQSGDEDGAIRELALAREVSSK